MIRSLFAAMLIVSAGVTSAEQEEIVTNDSRLNQDRIEEANRPIKFSMGGKEDSGQAFLFKDAGDIPNNPTLPVLIYPGVVPHDAEKIEALFTRNGWRPAWRYSVYPFPHYHSTAHEVLGVYRGRAKIRLGHNTGQVFEVKAGDVIVIPAGVGHENLGASADFHVVGGYPPGQSADLLRGESGERPRADEAIRKVALPQTDPVLGQEGPLTRLWKEK